MYSYIYIVSIVCRLCVLLLFLDVYLMSQKLLKLCFIECRKSTHTPCCLSFNLPHTHTVPQPREGSFNVCAQLKIDKLFMPRRPHARKQMPHTHTHTHTCHDAFKCQSSSAHGDGSHRISHSQRIRKRPRRG